MSETNNDLIETTIDNLCCSKLLIKSSKKRLLKKYTEEHLDQLINSLDKNIENLEKMLKFL